MKKIVSNKLSSHDIEMMNSILSSDSIESSFIKKSILSTAGANLVGMTGAAYTGVSLISLFKKLVAEGENLTKSRKDIMIVEEYLTRRGYVRKDGSKDYVRFYEAAYISEGAWSKYYSGTKHQKSTSKDTLFKIVIALRMSLDDAMLFLQYAGSGFFSGSKRDMVIYAFIKNEYLGREDTYDAVCTAYELLEYYSKIEVEQGNEPLKQLYVI